MFVVSLINAGMKSATTGLLKVRTDAEGLEHPLLLSFSSYDGMDLCNSIP